MKIGERASNDQLLMRIIDGYLPYRIWIERIGHNTIGCDIFREFEPLTTKISTPLISFDFTFSQNMLDALNAQQVLIEVLMELLDNARISAA